MERILVLPSELSSKATLHQQEYAWSVDDFPSILEQAPSLGYACLGGQFWLLLNPGEIYELFWLEADSSERLVGETWTAYAERSCREVAVRFDSLLRSVDFRKEALKFNSLNVPHDLLGPPVFNAYFITEQEWSDLQPPPSTMSYGNDTACCRLRHCFAPLTFRIALAPATK